MNRNLEINFLDYLQTEEKHGQTIWPFHLDKIEPWAYSNAAFTPAQCKTIIEIGKNQTLDTAITGGGNNPAKDDKIRKSRTSWISPAGGNEWIFQRMTDVVMHLNKQFFNFELWGFGEGFQFTEYQSPGGHYKPHIDCMYNGRIRKLSVVCQLTDPAEYEGGELIVNNGDEIILPKDQGTVLVFPSYSLHGVKPVTSGARYSLVAWLTGPAFK